MLFGDGILKTFICFLLQNHSVILAPYIRSFGNSIGIC